jgi:hypothetical protein
MRRPAFLALLTFHIDSAEPAYPNEFRMPSCIVSVTLFMRAESAACAGCASMQTTGRSTRFNSCKARR